MARGPEYAEQLTDAERRVLDALLAEVSPAPVARRSWRPPLVVGIVSLLILLAAASAPLLRATSPPAGQEPAGGEPAGGEAAPSVADVLSDLATAAARVPDPADPAEQWYRHRLDVRVSMSVYEPGACRVTAVTTKLWEGVDTDKWHHLSGRLEAKRVDPPGAAAELAGCGAPKPDPPSANLDFASDEPGVAWFEMVETLGRAGVLIDDPDEPLSLEWPVYEDPRWPALLLAGVTSVDRVDQHLHESGMRHDHRATGSPSSLWWLAFVRGLATPVSDAASRAAMLRAAAGHGEAVLVPEITADVMGRPGVTLRVPYYGDWQDRTAALTFDLGTGALLQRVVYTDTHVDITAYLAMERR